MCDNAVYAGCTVFLADENSFVPCLPELIRGFDQFIQSVADIKFNNRYEIFKILVLVYFTVELKSDFAVRAKDRNTFNGVKSHLRFALIHVNKKIVLP